MPLKKVFNSHVLSFGLGLAVASLAFRWLNNPSKESVENNNEAKRKVAVFFGDSITQRGFEIEAKGFVASIADWWTRKVDVVNRGFSGYNSKWAQDIFEDVVLSANPHIVFIFFGANDAVDPSVAQHVLLADYKRYVESLVVALKKVISLVSLIIFCN